MTRSIVLASATVIVSTFGGGLCAQSAPAVQTVKAPDERMKADILVVVAHPDDEGGVTPYLARAIYDEGKRVAVVFATRGGSGGNDYSREHGPALADIREQEARAACAKLGITNVWFLDGKDTASQNVLNSLANWGHGANLESLVRIVRLTRPEVIITWLPGVFIGENHGDHQAAGVLATEAFDLANDPTAFPAQVAGATKRLEVYVENLTPWQPKKLYFFSDADDQKQFDGTGPAYSIKEVSPSQKKPYWRLAIEAATPHLTQFPDVQQLQKMNEEQLNKFFDDPKNMFWPEPMTLTLGKAVEKIEATEPIFPKQAASSHHKTDAEPPSEEKYPPMPNPVGHGHPIPSVGLGGPWAFYHGFYLKHQLRIANRQPSSRIAVTSNSIAVKNGSLVTIPILVGSTKNTDLDHLSFKVSVPNGWSVVSGEGRVVLPAEAAEMATCLMVEVQAPTLSTDELKAARPVEIKVEVQAYIDRNNSGYIPISIPVNFLLKKSALPQN